VSAAPYPHIGLIVPELEPAIAAYAKLGLTFMEPRTVHVDRLVEGDRASEIDLRITVSELGPPRWELLEAVGDGIYGPQHIGVLHHVALVDPDPERKLRELLDSGHSCVGAQYREDGSMIVAYLESPGLSGVRIELMHAPVQDTIEAWVAGLDASP
jgi:hypothetical protein